MSSRNKRRNRRNTQSQSANQRNEDRDYNTDGPAVVRRSSTETKPSVRTTELAAYAAAVLAVVLTALAVDDDGQGGTDPFGAEHAIRYITYLTVGYMVARGLAKAGSHENDEGPRTDLDEVGGRDRETRVDARDGTRDVGSRDDDRDGEAEARGTDAATSDDGEDSASPTPTEGRDAADVVDRPAGVGPDRAS